MVEEFITGHWYLYKGKKILHCTVGEGVFASFYDSPWANKIRTWSNLNDFLDITDKIKRNVLKDFLCS